MGLQRQCRARGYRPQEESGQGWIATCLHRSHHPLTTPRTPATATFSLLLLNNLSLQVVRQEVEVVVRPALAGLLSPNW